jgi:hypothetical protein
LYSPVGFSSTKKKKQMADAAIVIPLTKTITGQSVPAAIARMANIAYPTMSPKFVLD